MPSILIHGGDAQKRKEMALNLLADRGIESDYNLTKVGEEKLGINEIKAFLPHLHVRPCTRPAFGGTVQGRSANRQRGFIIFEAQQLTIAAQNSLLKILEEPPAHLVIILTAPHPRLLLPTVVSRCLTTPLREAKQVRVPLSGTRTVLRPHSAKASRDFEGQVETRNKTVEEIFAAQGGQRLALFEEKIGYRQEDVLVFLNEAEAYLKESLNSKTAQSLTKLWQAKKLLRNESANIKLVIDELLLSTPLGGEKARSETTPYSW